MGIIRKIALFTQFLAICGAATVLAGFAAERVYAGNYNVEDDDE